jgi:hypothetical protein
MRKERFSVEQTVAVLKQAELGLPVAELIGRSGSRSSRSTGGRSSTPVSSRTKCGSSSR